MYRALCVKAGKKRYQCPNRRVDAARILGGNCCFWRGTRQGLFAGVYCCPPCPSFLVLLSANVCCCLLVSTGLAVKIAVTLPRLPKALSYTGGAPLGPPINVVRVQVPRSHWQVGCLKAPLPWKRAPGRHSDRGAPELAWCPR